MAIGLKGLSWQRRSEVTWAVYDAFAEATLAREPLYKALMTSAALRRLRNVRFLGAIELFSTYGRNRRALHQSRYSHSVGVAYLAHRICKALSCPPGVEEHLVSAALLHDVGHGALSHSSEPYFGSRFGISHRHVGSRLINGDLFLGNEVREILGDYGVDPRELNRIVEGSRTDGQFPPLFAVPINIDTLDGIVRSASFFAPQVSLPFPDHYAKALIDPSPSTMDLADEFWRLKECVYRDFIYDAKWSINDQLLTLVLEDAGDRVRATDFYLADDDFCSKFSRQIARVQDWLPDLEFAIGAHLAQKPKARAFVVNQMSKLHSWKQMEKRYAVRRL